MPSYLLKNKDTGDVYEEWMTVSEKEQFMEEHPEFVQVMTAPSIVSGVSGRAKVDGGFREVLSKISEAHPNSALSKSLGGRTVEQVKTEKVTNKLFKSGRGHVTHDGGF